MTGLSNREERLNRFARNAKWPLEDKLKELGVDYRKALLPLRPFIVVDRTCTRADPPMRAGLAWRSVSYRTVTQRDWGAGRWPGRYGMRCSTPSMRW